MNKLRIEVNAGLNRANWKSRTKLKKMRKLEDDVEFLTLEDSINRVLSHKKKGQKKKGGTH